MEQPSSAMRLRSAHSGYCYARFDLMAASGLN
jgi:hypothetical protein